MKAVVMAGGEGSRLRPLTIGRPKPLVPVVNQPVMSHILDLLERHGITEIVATVQYLANVIQEYYGNGRDSGRHIVYSVEDTPLGTAGSVKNAQQHLDDTFIVISGDALTDIDLSAAVAFHKSKRALATLVLYRVPNPLEYGVVITDENGHITQFLEKPSWSEVFSDTVNTGIYVLEPQVLDYFQSGRPFDFSQDLFPMMLAKGDPIYGYVAPGYWCDVGNLEEYTRASADLLMGKVKLAEKRHVLEGGIWAEDSVEIAPSAQVYGPVYVGAGCKIRDGAIVRGPSVIRDWCIVDNGAFVDRSIIWRNSYIGERAQVRGAIIGHGCNIKSRATVNEGAVVGDRSMVGEGVTIHSSVKIWPDKQIEAGATVRSSLIWGAQARRALFSQRGVAGLVNVDMTPEFAARVGAAYGATLPVGGTVTMNRDAHRGPRMIKRAIIAGLPSTGVNVEDLANVPIPVARYYTRASKATGGIHIGVSAQDRRQVEVRFFDSQGLDLTTRAQRRVEQAFFREDFRRVYYDEIGSIDYAPRVVETYVENLLKLADPRVVQEAKFNLVVDYANSSASQVLPQVLARLGIDIITLNASIEEKLTAEPEQELRHGLDQLKVITSALGADLGVRIDGGGETLYLVDSQGQLWSGTDMLAALALLALRTCGKGSIAVPVTVPRIMETIAQANQGTLVRTRNNPYSLMAAALSEDMLLVGNAGGNIIIPESRSGPDAMATVVKLLEYLAARKTNLREVLAALPPYHAAQITVPCRWEAKGQVMRRLHEEYCDQGVKQIDGILIETAGKRVQIMPDSDMPLFHLYADADSQDEAEHLVEQYAQVVSALQD